VTAGQALQFLLVAPGLEAALADFFVAVEQAGDTAKFHPHPFTAEEAARRCAYLGKDLYYVALLDRRVLGYGMLRGWDEGFDVPSLGIALHPKARATGLARALMTFLHAAAKVRGATKVRLKVYPDNTKALELYRSLGYRWIGEQGGQLVGILELEPKQTA